MKKIIYLIGLYHVVMAWHNFIKGLAWMLENPGETAKKWSKNMDEVNRALEKAQTNREKAVNSVNESCKMGFLRRD